MRKTKLIFIFSLLICISVISWRQVAAIEDNNIKAQVISLDGKLKAFVKTLKNQTEALIFEKEGRRQLVSHLVPFSLRKAKGLNGSFSNNIYFSGDNKFLIYETYHFEVTSVNVYSIIEDKIVANFIDPLITGFNSNNKFFYACASRAFSGAVYISIYSIKDFSLTRSLLPDKPDKDFIPSYCVYDKITDTLSYGYSDDTIQLNWKEFGLKTISHPKIKNYIYHFGKDIFRREQL